MNEAETVTKSTTSTTSSTSVTSATSEQGEQGEQQFKVEVAYALPEQQLILEVMVAEGTTLQQAVELSGITKLFAEIDLEKNKLGVFGKLSKKTDPVKAGDRVEVYRPLIADPKEVRRQREAEGKRMKKGGGEEADAAAG